MEAGSAAPGLRYFACRFEELFEVVLVDPESGRESVLEPRTPG